MNKEYTMNAQMEIPNTIAPVAANKEGYCVGCSSCRYSCPTGAISMVFNEEGFKIPLIDEVKCVHCGKCRTACPVCNPVYDKAQKPRCFAAQASDELRTGKSASGAIFPVLAEKILEDGGVVCGAAWNDNWQCEHIIVDTVEGLERIKNSKYVQSDLESCLPELKRLLNAGCEPELVDVAPVALYNTVRFNYPDADGCTLVVDIGARCTNLVFVEQDRIFYRTIPVAGNTITSEIAKAFGLSQEEAETFKCEQGLVAQGGAFAVDDPDVDRLSKVIRNVMTRLNAEVTRSIAFYRSQQEGSAPTRVLLSGASSQLPYMQNFFEEKLQVAAEFLNPFQTVAYPTDIDADQFGRDAFSLPVLVGLALRRGLTCPVEINLVSQDITARKEFRRRLPFFAIAAAGLVFIMGIWLVYVGRMGALYEQQAERIRQRITAYESQKARFDKEDKAASAAEARAAAYRTLLESRQTWLRMLVAVNKAIPEGLWVTRLSARRDGQTLRGLDLSVSVWKDQEGRLSASGKTIDETVAAKLAGQDVFAADVKDIPISKKTQSPWMTSFDITANLRAVEMPKEAKGRTARRSRR